MFLIFNFAFYRNNANTSPDKKRIRKSYRSKTYKVEISLASKIPLQAIADALKGHATESYQEAIRVLDIILRQHAAKQCVLS
jgi:eukaryotic translation initiation factor 2C